MCYTNPHIYQVLRPSIIIIIAY